MINAPIDSPISPPAAISKPTGFIWLSVHCDERVARPLQLGHERQDCSCLSRPIVVEVLLKVKTAVAAPQLHLDCIILGQADFEVPPGQRRCFTRMLELKQIRCHCFRCSC